MRALVTGVAGFIGSHLAKRLIDDGHEVYGIDDLSTGYRKNLHPQVKFFHADISKQEKMDWFFSSHKVDVIFHNAAAKKSTCLRNPHLDLEINAKGTLLLLQHALKQDARFIHASTGSIYGEASEPTQSEDHRVNPASFYGVSKLAGDKYVQMYHKQFGLRTTILRYSSVYGPNQEEGEFGGVIAIFKKALRENKPVTFFGDGDQIRGFTHVSDVVEANVCSLDDKAIGQIYNCASAELHTLKDLAVMLGIKNIIHKNAQIDDIKKFRIDNSKIVKDFGICFRSLKDGLWE